mmetsp:Transcript_13497/g.27245  ORF Transcript_13497/g.27245 Transcript_13497/m.27245 type:complete len:129 (+) Transcript_13497:95-481(+)
MKYALLVAYQVGVLGFDRLDSALSTRGSVPGTARTNSSCAHPRLPQLIHFILPPGGKLGALPALSWVISFQQWLRWFPAAQGFHHLFWDHANLTSCLADQFPAYLAAHLALHHGSVEQVDVGRYCLLH